MTRLVQDNVAKNLNSLAQLLHVWNIPHHSFKIHHWHSRSAWGKNLSLAIAHLESSFEQFYIPLLYIQ